jgi:hypothetical protein
MKLYRNQKVSSLIVLSFILLCVFASLGLAATDPSINDWGSPPGSPPPWQTTDIWTDNDGDGILNEAGEPSKGIKNRLFAKIRNLGSTPTNNITVKFAYAPYGAWGWASYSDFKEISVVTGVNLTQAGTADAEKTIEVEWDLRDLSENNEGKWGGYTVGDFDHFCVWVKIEYSVDSNAGNNDARNNFINVQTVFGQPYSLKFIVANPKKEQINAEITVKGLPDDWRPLLKGVQNDKNFVLKPKEFRLITLTFTPPPFKGGAERIKKNVDISLKLGKDVAGGISFAATVEKERPMIFMPSGGMLSPYIIGTFETREGAKTIIQIINPTAKHLRAMAAFFDDNEKPLKCIKDKLSPNDLLEIDVRKIELPAKFGVVKVVSLNEKEDIPETGVVGNQRIFFKEMGAAETALHQIPAEVLTDDLKYIWKICK